MTRLVITRKPGESITIGDDITVTLISVHGRSVRIVVDAPREIAVHRDEQAKAGPPVVMRYPTGRPGWLGEYQTWPCTSCGADHDDSSPHACIPTP